MSCGIDQSSTRHRVVINHRRRGVVSNFFYVLFTLGRTKRQSSDLFSESSNQGINANANQVLSDVAISDVANTGMEPSAVGTGTCHPSECCLERSTSDRTVYRARFRCLALRSSADHDALPMRGRQDHASSKAIRMLMPSGVLCCFGQRAKKCALTSSAVIIGSHAPTSRPRREVFLGRLRAGSVVRLDQH